MKGFISAVAFATILAVVSGLTLSGASAVSHDLYASVFRRGQADERSEIRVSRITTVVLGIVAILLGIAFEKINVAFMVGLAFAIAASANFPVLLLSMLLARSNDLGRRDRRLRRAPLRPDANRLSPAIWERCSAVSERVGAVPLQHRRRSSRCRLAFLCCWLFSVSDRSRSAREEVGRFEAQYIRSQTGIGAAGASSH